MCKIRAKGRPEIVDYRDWNVMLAGHLVRPQVGSLVKVLDGEARSQSPSFSQEVMGNLWSNEGRNLGKKRAISNRHNHAVSTCEGMHQFCNKAKAHISGTSGTEDDRSSSMYEYGRSKPVFFGERSDAAPLRARGDVVWCWGLFERIPAAQLGRLDDLGMPECGWR